MFLYMYEQVCHVILVLDDEPVLMRVTAQTGSAALVTTPAVPAVTHIHQSFIVTLYASEIQYISVHTTIVSAV